MEKIVEQNLLFDFYGELLTEHQQSVYRDAVFNDMSLSEVADNYGISRQGVHDLLKRCDKTMQEYEDKLHLISRFSSVKEKLLQIAGLTDGLEHDDPDHKALADNGQQIRKLTAEILEEL